MKKKYLEMGAEEDSFVLKEELGFLWYYGLCGKPDYEKAYRYFIEAKGKRSKYMLADMYSCGQYVRKDKARSRKILEQLFDEVESDYKETIFWDSTVFPEVALRLARLNIEEEQESLSDLECLISARKILSVRQKNSPFWGNLKTMRSILRTIELMTEKDSELIDLYDLLTFEREKAVVTFECDGVKKRLDIFPNGGEVVYQFEDRWFHGAEDFLEKARIGKARVTSIIDRISNIEIAGGKRKNGSGSSESSNESNLSLLRKINERLAARYKLRLLCGKRFYELPNGEIIRVVKFTALNAYVVEYAENIEEAEKNWFEDGEVFYESDYSDEEALIEDVLWEIEAGCE